MPPRLFQESLKRTPFWMLLACCLVNQTTWRQARPAFREIRRRYTIQTLASACPEDLQPILQPLGLWRTWAERLPMLAHAWLHKRPSRHNDVLRLPGCGRYAADSWAIFIEGDFSVQPSDLKLKSYIEGRRQE